MKSDIDSIPRFCSYSKQQNVYCCDIFMRQKMPLNDLNSWWVQAHWFCIFCPDRISDFNMIQCQTAVSWNFLGTWLIYKKTDVWNSNIYDLQSMICIYYQRPVKFWVTGFGCTAHVRFCVLTLGKFNLWIYKLKPELDHRLE